MRIPRPTRHSGNRHLGGAADGGFTMIETIVALTIFVVISVAATAAVVAGTNAAKTSRNRVTGTNVVQSDLEQARTLPTPASTAYVTAPAGASDTYSVSRTVTMPSPSGGTACPAGSLIKISSVVSWSGGGQTVRADTVLAC